jgi:hypothetical protein
MIAFQRRLFFNFLCDIRLKESNEYLTPLELATFRQIQSGVEYLLDDYDENTKKLLGNVDN